MRMANKEALEATTSSGSSGSWELSELSGGVATEGATSLTGMVLVSGGWLEQLSIRIARMAIITNVAIRFISISDFCPGS